MKIKYTIKETKYIRKDVVVAYYIQNHVEDLDTTTKILQSLEFANKVTAEDIFEDYDNFAYGNNRYVVLKGEMGIFIVREDNVKCYYKNTKEKLGIDYLFSSGNKTFLIDGYGFKFITTRQKEDTDDIEKAIDRKSVV